MALAVLFAGIAQAAHFHKEESQQHAEVHLQCLLCMHSAGNAGAAELPRVVPVVFAWRSYTPLLTLPRPQSDAHSFYDARGPPTV